MSRHSALAEAPPRRGELLDPDDVRSVRGAAGIPQAVHRAEHVRSAREAMQEDLGLVGEVEVVEVLGTPIQPRLCSDAGVAGLGEVARWLMDREVRPEQLAAVVVDVLDPALEPVVDPDVAQESQDRLGEAEVTDDQVRGDARAARKLDPAGPRARHDDAVDLAAG